MRGATFLHARIFLATLCLLTAFAPLAAADESHADCETGQPWIGYGSTDAVRAIVRPALAEQGLLMDACEGEQWDGQDSVEPDEVAACSGTARLDPSDLFVGFCAKPDINSAPSNDLLEPVALRLSAKDLREVYAGANVALVARGALYVGTCGAGEPGLEGEASCAGTRALRTGLYLRDNTPGNAIVTLLCFRVNGCGWPEGDCSQAVYQQGAYDPPSRCSRDNTAFSLDIVHLP